MSKNALALVDCSNREKLFHFLINTFDRKATKNEMISPYDDQLIGKMNFRYNGMEHSMFFTYARSSEYPGMKFRNHKIIYLSLGVNETSSDIFQQVCTRFGGYIIHNDDLEIGWEKIDRQQPENDDDLSLSADIVAERHFLLDIEGESKERKLYQELKLEPDMEEEAEEREWAAPELAVKAESKQDSGREKRETNRNNRNSRGNRQEKPDKKADRQEPVERKENGKDNNKITNREPHKESGREQQKGNQKDGQKDAGKGEQKQNSHRRGHRGGRKHSSKPHNKENGGNGNANSNANNSAGNNAVTAADKIPNRPQQKKTEPKLEEK